MGRLVACHFSLHVAENNPQGPLEIIRQLLVGAGQARPRHLVSLRCLLLAFTAASAQGEERIATASSLPSGVEYIVDVRIGEPKALRFDRKRKPARGEPQFHWIASLRLGRPLHSATTRRATSIAKVASSPCAPRPEIARVRGESACRPL